MSNELDFQLPGEPVPTEVRYTAHNPLRRPTLVAEHDNLADIFTAAEEYSRSTGARVIIFLETRSMIAQFAEK